MNQFCQSTCNTCVNINGTNKSVSASSILFGQPRSGLKYSIIYIDSQNCFLDKGIYDSVYCNPTNWTEFYLVDVPSTISLLPTAGQFQLFSSVSAGSTVYSFSTKIILIQIGYPLFGQLFGFPATNLYTYKVNLPLNQNVTNLVFSLDNFNCFNFNSLTVRVYLLVSQDNLFNNVFIDLKNMLYDYSKIYLSNEKFANFNLTSGYNQIDLLNLYYLSSKKYSGFVNYIGIIVMPENKLQNDSYCKSYEDSITLNIGYGIVQIPKVTLDSAMIFNTDISLLFNQSIQNHPLTFVFTYNVNLTSNIDVLSLNFSIDNSNNCNVSNNLTMSIYLIVPQSIQINSADEVQKLYSYSMLYLSNKPFEDFVLQQGYNSIDLVNLYHDAINNYYGVANYIYIIVIFKNILQSDVYCEFNQNNVALGISFGKDKLFQGAVSFQSTKDNKYLRLGYTVIRFTTFSPFYYAGDRAFYIHQKDSYLSIQSARPSHLFNFIGKNDDSFKVLSDANVPAFSLVVIGLVIKSIESINRYSVNVTINSVLPVWHLKTDFVVKCKDPNGVVNLYPVTNYIAIISSLQSNTLYKFYAGLKNEFGFYVYGPVFLYQTDKDNVSKTLCKVLNAVTLQGNLLLMNLQIYPTFNESLNAYVEFEFFLPPYLSFTSGNVIQNFVKADGNRIKYFFTGRINSSEIFNYNFTGLFNDTKCPLPGIFTLDIPLKISIQVELGKPTVFFKAFRKVVECFGYPNIPIVKDQLILKESYGRGIYWDAKNLIIYVCMNQHFPSTKVACYVSNDEGSLWYELDVQVGSVLGHHLLTNELYAVHRNQKTYMMFHNIYKKWLSITKQQFTETASNFIDPSMRKNLEGDFNQIYTLGPNKWLGNSQGLFLLHRNGTWILRIRWRF
ncbi:uncharacterized protein LOC105843977 isoform X2 [Hydra vulgaris]|nr:uncharacterized protein LOC105843977 [Hydra vulgaris]